MSRIRKIFNLTTPRLYYRKCVKSAWIFLTYTYLIYKTKSTYVRTNASERELTQMNANEREQTRKMTIFMCMCIFMVAKRWTNTTKMKFKTAPQSQIFNGDIHHMKTNLITFFFLVSQFPSPNLSKLKYMTFFLSGSRIFQNNRFTTAVVRLKSTDKITSGCRSSDSPLKVHVDFS